MDVRVVALVAWGLLVVCVSSQTSSLSGWFGSQCQYKCHCTSDVVCGADGECADGRCGGGWFGPACQFVDLAYRKASSLSGLIDYDDKTCVSTSQNTATITLGGWYLFTWLRVRVSNSDALQNLTVIFNSDLSCINPRNSSVDDKTLDIHCELNQRVQNVTLTGKGVQDLCSVYISGGRKVALKQNTSQSSTYWEQIGRMNISFTSDKAVDGDTSGVFYTGYPCSCTRETNTSSNWTVRFSKPQRVTRYVLYNRQGRQDLKDRLKGFILESFNERGNRVFNYTDRTASGQGMYSIPSGNVTSPVSRVMIKKNVPTFLTICELEVYGDSVCEPGQYGRECEHKCNCARNEACFVSTGGCPSGCADGFQGENCNKSCSPKTYGPGCTLNCSELCFHNSTTSCNNIDGVCLHGCVSGYQGKWCNESCTHNKWGDACSSECSPNCVPHGDKSPCDNVNGTCQLGCKKGYVKPLCTKECPNGTFGQDCNSSCHYCNGFNNTGASPCDNIDGFCHFGCASGLNLQECKQKQGPSEDDDKNLIIGAVVGSVLGATVVVAVIIGVVFCVRKYKKKKSEAVPDHPVEFSIESRFSQKPSTKIPPATKKQDTAAGNITHGVYYNSIGNVSPPSTVVSLDELEDYMTSRSRDFFKDQFNAIPSNEQATMTAGMSSENKTKNRYKNVCAYDHSRVHLIPNSGKKQGDYINASYTEGYKADEKFIASQGPTKIILEDFVRMLWEQEVEKVVMLTNLIEEGKHKCERYWPEDDEMRVGEIIIKLATTKVFADYTIRILQLRKEGKPPQDLTHYHFTSWPDKDIPTAPWGLVDFEQRVAAHSTNRPIVVHCSAGIGRTGTFIALRNVMRQAEETGSMDFFKTVQKLRHDRINMVQTAEQYIFLHKAAQVAMLCIGTTVTSFDIQNRIKTLQTKTQTGETRMEKEFKAICSACDEKEEEKKTEENPYSVYENSQNLLNRKKNRLSNILAKEMYRAILMNEKSDVEDYINAVLVPSFTKQNQQILTQLPLPTTVTDFWRLVTQYKVALIVAFQVDLKTTDQTIGNYLPTDENEPLTSSMFEIRTEPKSVSKFWKQQKLVVAVDTERMSKVTAVKIIDKEHHVTHLTCTTTDLDPRAMLTITEYVRSLKPAGDRRILYMCRNGANYSGMLCVLQLLLDRMDNDGCLTVPLVVGAMKAIRPQVIPTLDQYKHLYEALQLYAQSTNEYSNFGSSST